MSLIDGWLIFGFTAQLVFLCRFVVQWVASEVKGRSVMPVAFWYLSLIGSAMLFLYASYRRDPIFILGQSLACFIYIRNLSLIYGKRVAEKAMTRRLGLSSILVLALVFTPLAFLYIYRTMGIDGARKKEIILPPGLFVEPRGASVRRIEVASIEIWVHSPDFEVRIENRASESLPARFRILNLPASLPLTLEGFSDWKEHPHEEGRLVETTLAAGASGKISASPEGFSFFAWNIPPGRLDLLPLLFAEPPGGSVAFSVGLGNYTRHSRAYEFAILREVVCKAGIPTYLLPGKKEFTGRSAGAPFVALFGKPPRAFRYRQVYVVMVDSSSGRLGESQVLWLKEKLESAPPGCRIIIFSYAGLPSGEASNPPLLVEKQERKEVLSICKQFKVWAWVSPSKSRNAAADQIQALNILRVPYGVPLLFRVRGSVISYEFARPLPEELTLFSRFRLLYYAGRAIIGTSLPVWALVSFTILAWLFLVFQMFGKFLGRYIGPKDHFRGVPPDPEQPSSS